MPISAAEHDRLFDAGKDAAMDRYFAPVTEAEVERARLATIKG